MAADRSSLYRGSPVERRGEQHQARVLAEPVEARTKRALQARGQRRRRRRQQLDGVAGLRSWPAQAPRARADCRRPQPARGCARRRAAPTQRGRAASRNPTRTAGPTGGSATQPPRAPSRTRREGRPGTRPVRCPGAAPGTSARQGSNGRASARRPRSTTARWSPPRRKSAGRRQGRPGTDRARPGRSLRTLRRALPAAGREAPRCGYVSAQAAGAVPRTRARTPTRRPTVASMRAPKALARPRAWSSNADFPIPGSPRMSSAPPCSRTRSRTASIRATSSLRPISSPVVSGGLETVIPAG